MTISLSTYPDYCLIKNKVVKLQSELDLKKEEYAFYYLILDLYFNLQDDEVDDAITDTDYLLNNSTCAEKGNDRGIDAIYIEGSDSNRPTIHLFNFKYATTFDNSKRNYSGNEVDKIKSVLHSFLSRENTLNSSINRKLSSKFEEIYNLHDMSDKPIRYKLYLCGNYYNKLESTQERRLIEYLSNYNIELEYILLEDILKLILNKNHISVDAKIKLIDTNYFITNIEGVTAIIAQVDVRELLKCIIDNPDIKKKVDYENYNFLTRSKILQDAFENNVRMYLQQKTMINKNIKKTALDPVENRNIFCYNNGITLTCSSYIKDPQERSPNLQLNNLQVVNGGQTLRALFDAHKENPEVFSKVDVLCKIYRTDSSEMSQKISEYTNSQNPVKSRDVHSIDIKQIKLEEEFKDKGYYYERKKNQYIDKPKRQRIDSEKAGQIILAYYCESPAEAKNKKVVIFGEKYERIFSEERSADDILFVLELFKFIEFKKKEMDLKINLEAEKENFELFFEYKFIDFASYYFLYFLRQIQKIKGISNGNGVSDLIKYYDNITKAIQTLIAKEKSEIGEKYDDAYYFKSDRLKLNYMKNEDEINKMLIADVDE